MAKKIRADQLLFVKGLAESREKAKRLIMAGQVFIKKNGGLLRLEKPGQQVKEDTFFKVKEGGRFVSRGGYKLLTAISGLGLDPTGAVCLDGGASTGGFTDCLLQHGAQKVYAVDVGYGQLDQRLRQDPRVINLERTNLRHVKKNFITEPIDIVVADVSFISLTKVLPPCLQFLRENGLVAALIKPQFEVGPGKTVKGVVKDEVLREEAIRQVIITLKNFGLTLKDRVPAQIKGPKGNQEEMALFILTNC